MEHARGLPGSTLTRRNLLAAGTGLAAGVAATTVTAQDSAEADFLFVQTADGMSFDPASNMLILRDVSPVTLFFSDRPERIAGNMRTERFIPFWSEGKDSFLSDPPNADISVIRDGALHQSVVVLTDPVLAGGDLTYTVQIVEGDPPAEGDAVSVFIDVIGMPMTPVSVAGARRRAFRRAALY